MRQLLLHLTANRTTVLDVYDLDHTPQSWKLCAMKDTDLVLLTTEEAAEYMRRSASWLLHRRDIAYLPGKPNLYRRRDLDTWVARNIISPKVKI